MKKVFKVFLLIFIAASAIFFETACNKETASETDAVIANQMKSQTAAFSTINQPELQKISLGGGGNEPIDDTHRENNSKYVLSNLPSTGAVQIYTTCVPPLYLDGPDPPPSECAEMPNVHAMCNSLTVVGVPSANGALLLKNAIGLAVGGQNVVYITTGNNSGLASNSLFRIDLSTNSGVFIAKTKTATGIPMPVQDIECRSINSGTAFGLVNNQLAILNLATGIYTLKTLPAGIYSGLTVVNNGTIAVFMPNHIAGATFGGYRTVNTTTWVVSTIIPWGSSSAVLVQGDGGFANSSYGLRVSSQQSTGISNVSCNTPYFIDLGQCRTMVASPPSVPVFDYTNY